MNAAEYPLAMFPPNKDMDPWVEEMLSVDLRSRRHVLKRFKPTPMRPFLYKYFSSNQGYSLQNCPALCSVGNSPSFTTNRRRQH
jgi:hypothetical protein